MKPKPFTLVLCLNSLICVSFAVNPACECVVYESYGQNHGIFTSPNFPEIYPTNINCILYTFIGDLGEIVELSFLEFDLQVPLTNKCTDVVRFWLDLERPEVNERHAHNYEQCGNISMIQKKHYSSSRSIILELHTDNIQGNHTGFRGRFEFLKKAQFEVKGVIKRWGDRCLYEAHSSPGNKEGRFFSPLYPQNYPPDTNCVYILHGLEKEKVKVIFKNIQLENIDGSCSDSPDTIVVRDGTRADSPVIAQYCNTQNGQQVISTGNALYILLSVDAKNQRQGFAATFEFFKEERLPSPLTTNSGPNSRQDGGNTEKPGDAPAPPTTPSMQPCTYTYTSMGQKNGTFTSPHFPNPYPANTVCRYKFRGEGRERVQIVFEEINLHYPSGDPKEPNDCEEVDTVEVAVMVQGKSDEVGLYCGSKRPPQLMSSDTTMDVIFTSHDRTDSAKGFKANYRFVTDFGINTGEQIFKNSVCGFKYRSEVAQSGKFKSPNFPGLYPRDTECHYLFYGRENERIFITFLYFDVEGVKPECQETSRSDYVEFSNFDIHLKDRKMKRFCGREEAGAIKEVSSDGDFFRVTFKSNEIYDTVGFDAFYQFRPDSNGPPETPVPEISSAPRLTAGLHITIIGFLILTALS